MTLIIFCAFSCMCRAQLWAESLGVPYSAEMWKVVCSQHFSESDFTSPECIRLNRMVVPTVAHISAIHSVACLHTKTPQGHFGAPLFHLVHCYIYLCITHTLVSYFVL